MKPFLIISLVAATALTTGCQSQDSGGRAEERERAARAAAQGQETPDQSQQNLQRAQQNVVNRDGNASRNLTGY
jgi:hypothetical protein